MFDESKQIHTLQFNNGLMAVDTKKLPMKVTAATTAPHGDWKTQSVRKNFMGLTEGEEAEMVKIWANFYGVWCRVKKQNGDTADIESKDLILHI